MGPRVRGGEVGGLGLRRRDPHKVEGGGLEGIHRKKGGMDFSTWRMWSI